MPRYFEFKSGLGVKSSLSVKNFKKIFNLTVFEQLKDNAAISDVQMYLRRI
jgi:hypothetical protein